MQQRLQVNLRKNDFVAGRLIDSYLFGADHPYGRYSSLEDYAALNIRSIKEFYTKALSGWTLCDFYCRPAAGRYTRNLIDTHLAKSSAQWFDHTGFRT